jgi:hypothetical protein
VNEIVVENADIERWIDGYLRKRFPQHEQAYRDALAAHRRSVASGVLSSADLATIVANARQKHAVLWEDAVRFLAALSRTHAAAREAIGEMARSKESHVRFAALCSVGYRSDPQLVRDVILPLISDKAGSVRWKAAEKAQHLRIVEALPLMEAQRRVEKSAKVLASLDLSIPLLRDGYILAPEADGHLLTVSGLGGLRSGHVSKDEIDRQGLAALVADWKAGLDQSAMVVRYSTEA